jgi:nucleotide-binding universal stress UspA family protein
MTTNPKFTTKKISNILVAIDGSENSFRAADYALELARLYTAKLYAVTVSFIPPQEGLTQKEVLNDDNVKDKTNGSQHSQSWFDDFNQKTIAEGIDFKPQLISSTRPVDYVLIEFAEETGIDLIVVGTRGKTGFKRLLLGSTASSVVTYAHCPVLVVK